MHKHSETYWSTTMLFIFALQFALLNIAMVCIAKWLLWLVHSIDSGCLLMDVVASPFTKKIEEITSTSIPRRIRQDSLCLSKVGKTAITVFIPVAYKQAC